MPVAEETVGVDVPAGHGVMHELNGHGDTRLMWNRSNTDEVAIARKAFDDARGKGFTAYRAEGKEGLKGEVITSFDPNAERVILVPRMVGG